MKVGDNVEIINDIAFEGCRGYIIKIIEGIDCCIVKIYKGNSLYTDDGIKDSEISFRKEQLKKLLRLKTEVVRRDKVTKIVSMKDSLEDIIPFFDFKEE